MNEPMSFFGAHPVLYAGWKLVSHDRAVHEPDRPKKITYTSRLILILEGEVRFSFADAEYMTGEGTLLCLPPACVYDSDFCTENFSSINLFFDLEPERLGSERFTEAFLRNIPSLGREDRSLVPTPTVFPDVPELAVPVVLAATERTTELIHEILREIESPDPLSSGYAGVLLTAVLVGMLRQVRGEREPKRSEAFRRITEYVAGHLDRRLSGEELASALNYHPYYMNRVVSSHAGVSLHEYILRAKLRQAKSMLTETNTPLAEIAQALAFCEGGHFSRVFAAHEGVPPSVFREVSRRV